MAKQMTMTSAVAVKSSLSSPVCAPFLAVEPERSSLAVLTGEVRVETATRRIRSLSVHPRGVEYGHTSVVERPRRWPL